MCKVHRATGSGKIILEDPGETKLADPGYFAKNKAYHCCKRLGHVKGDYPKFAQKRSKNKCEYPGYTINVGHTTDRCCDNPKNKKDRPANWVSHIKKNPSETSTVEIFL